MPTIVNANGTAAGVTSTERLMTQSVYRPDGYAVALENGDAWCFADTAVTPTGGADVFCRVANLSSMPLIITKITAQSATAEIIAVQTSVNYTSGGTHAEAVARNANASSSKLWTTYGTFESDVNITGDSGVELCRLACGVSADSRTLDLTGGNEIVIPQGYSLLLESVTGAVALTYTVFGYMDMQPAVSE